ncbi:MAG: peptidase, partial [Tardiphaga sp.]|nr:peptidase [Tardiphaga sp.]
TTFTVGTVSGGTSVNAIAAEARMAVDMRSNSTEELLKLEARLLDLVKQAAAEENQRWHSDKITVEIKLIGDRPAGIVAEDSPIVQATQRAVTVLTRAPRVTFAGSSTDSNLAMSLGIPAVTIGGGGEGGNWHSRNEWYRPVNAWFGPQNALLTMLVLSGLDGVTKPMLPARH